MKLKILFTLILLHGLFFNSFAQTSKITISTEAEIKTEMELAPCKGRSERREAVKQLFLKMGAAESDIAFEKLDDVENVVVTKKGNSNEIVVVGAHFDKTETGCGAIDNWSGIVIIANLYRTIKNLKTAKTYQFVAFDKEEAGLLGSNALAKEIPKERRAGYCAMVNFDSFGFSYPQAMRNISSASLVDLAEDVAKEMQLPFAIAAIDFASSDSESFRTRDIPAITFHGLDNRWRDYLHTSSDKVSKVNMQSVYIGYRLGVVFVSEIENKPCDFFRKEKKK